MYEWVKATREEVFRYCDSLPADDFLRELPGFGHGSIRNTLFHAAHCYWFWLGGFALGENVPSQALRAEYPDVAAIRSAFARSDDLLARFLDRHGPDLDAPLSSRLRRRKEPLVVTPRWLFTHAVTHEFHHKGQVVSMGRLLGYPPPDTDLVNPLERDP